MKTETPYEYFNRNISNYNKHQPDKEVQQKLIDYQKEVIVIKQRYKNSLGRN